MKDERAFIIEVNGNKKLFFFNPYQLMQEILDYYKIPYEMMTKEELNDRYADDN